MTTIKAETILSSTHTEEGVPMIWSGMWTYPRWIHAEGRTHRLVRITEDTEVLVATPSPMEDENLSRNAASSRAIPVKTMIEAILADPAVPLFWGKNIAGMQANEELDGYHKKLAYEIWMRSMDSAIMYAKQMCELGIDDDRRPIGAHKQIVNRILEPYMHIKVFVTATNWSNFLALRDHPAAEPHIQMLAQSTREELAKKPMQFLTPGQWHLPWVKREDWQKFEPSRTPHPDLIKLSVARSAHTSYKTVDGKEMTSHLATELADRLLSAKPLHASPTEHQVKADRRVTATRNQVWEGAGLEGNLSPGWVQFRKTLANESL